MPAPPQIVKLVNRFRKQYDSYRQVKYKEMELRQEFVDPFFKALGWDVDNEQDYAEAYKEVVHESADDIDVSHVDNMFYVSLNQRYQRVDTRGSPHVCSTAAASRSVFRF